MPQLKDGIDFITGNVLSFQQMNRMKNHWYDGADPPSNPVSGMIWVKNDGVAYVYFGAAWVALAGGAATFVALTDTPANYAGAASKLVRVNATPDALEFVAQSALDHGGFGGLADVGDHNWASTKTTAAWSKSIGGGGDYADWATMIAAMPDLIAHAVTVTIETGTTLTEICNLKNKHGLTVSAAITIQAEKYYPTASVIPTADSATATTLRDAELAAAAFGNDYFNGCWILIVAGTGSDDNGHVLITDYIDATGDVVVAAWPGTEPDNTSRYIILGAMIDGGSARSKGFDIINNTVPIYLRGIGIKDTTDTGITARYLFFLDAYYIGIYETPAEGFNLRNVSYARLRRCGFVKCGTQGVDITACSYVGLVENGISDNVAYGVTVRQAGFCSVTNNFGDNNGTWGTYLYRSGHAVFVGTECSGSSGNHQWADGNFQDVAVYGTEMKPGQPSFLAYNSVTDPNVTGDNTIVAVAFDTEIFDQGGDFAGNTFTAPVDGRYVLETIIRVDDLDAGTYESVFVRIVTSNRSYYIWKTGLSYYGGGINSFKLFVIADMDADDTATVDIRVTGGVKSVDIFGSGDPHTFFSGALIC